MCTQQFGWCNRSEASAQYGDSANVHFRVSKYSALSSISRSSHILRTLPAPRNVAHRCSAIVVAVGILASFACEPQPAGTPSSPPSDPAQAARAQPLADTTLPVAPRDSALRFPFVPDLARTPGAALEVTAADICVPGYAKKVRNVPAAVKRQAYAQYGILSHQPGDYEVDHLISLELGGSNSIRNLWPQSYRTQPWNARVKDVLENNLHRRVCAGTLDLATAQRVIASNWVSGYRKYVRPTPPPPRASNHRRRSARSHGTAQPAVP